MSDQVVVEDVQESLEATEEVAEATPAFDETTWKKRLAGKDQALTRAMQERDQLRKEADDLRRWKADQEKVNMTELEREQARAKELESELAQARRDAERERLARKNPLFAEFLEEASGLSADEAEEVFQKVLAKAKADAGGLEPEPEVPRVDPNRNRRNPPAAPKKRTASDIENAIEALGNPWQQ